MPPATDATATVASASRTRDLVAAALVTALLAASAWIAIPLGTVPVTLQVFVVVLAALLLTPGWAAASVGVYVVLGAIGVPVFSQGTAGLGVLLGPTGGYIIGFAMAAPFGASVRLRIARRGVRPVAADIAAATAAIATIYLLGWAQLALATNMGWVPAFLVGVAPFVVADVIKAAVAIGVASAVRKAGVRR